MKANSKKSITFYNKDGNVLAVYPLKGGTYHEDRCKIAKKNGLLDWSHYSVYDSTFGMKKDDPTVFCEIINGKITKESNHNY